jgi:hypothetical protein
MTPIVARASAITLVTLSVLPGIARAACVRPTLRAAEWPAASSPRLPGVRLRLPVAFARDSAEDTYPLDPAPRGSRWTDGEDAQVSVFLTDGAGSPLLSAGLPVREAGRGEFSRCVERAGSGWLTIVSYNKREEVGDMAYIGPFQVFAEYRSARGTVIHFAGFSKSRSAFEQLLAAVRTLSTVER